MMGFIFPKWVILPPEISSPVKQLVHSAVMACTCSPATQEAEAGRLLGHMSLGSASVTEGDPTS
jgi:hypothetical protein